MLLIILSIFSIVLLSGNHGAEYEEPCDHHTICIDGSVCIYELESNKSTCGCPPGRIWYPLYSACFIPVGPICDCILAPLDCHPGSYCNGTRCVCQPGSNELETGACTSLLGMPCSEEHKQFCEEGLDCKEGLCFCDSASTSWTELDASTRTQKCSGVINGECKHECPKNSHCSGTCKCDKGYSATLDGGCLKTHGSACHRDVIPHLDDPCNWDEGLVCREETCECNDPSQKWNSKMNKCVFKLGDPCGLYDGFPMECDDPNASCVTDNLDKKERKCKCNPLWIQAGNKCQIDKTKWCC